MKPENALFENTVRWTDSNLAGAADDEELESFENESAPAQARGLPDVSGDDLDTLIDEMEDELPGQHICHCMQRPDAFWC